MRVAGVKGGGKNGERSLFGREEDKNSRAVEEGG